MKTLWIILLTALAPIVFTGCEHEHYHHDHYGTGYPGPGYEHGTYHEFDRGWDHYDRDWDRH